MKKLVYVLVAATTWLLASCGEAFFEDGLGEMTTKSSSLRALDISTTNITAMTEADFQALDAAMERLGVEYDGRYYVISRTDYRNLNISKNLYWFVKQTCENSNRIVASLFHSSSFPLIRDGSPENETSTGNDCVGYALYGVGVDKNAALSYVRTHYPNGVLPEELLGVVQHFIPSAYYGTIPSQTGSISPSIVWYEENGFRHAVNGIYYDDTSGNLWCLDHTPGRGSIVRHRSLIQSIVFIH